MYEVIQRLLKAAPDTATGMRRLIDRCAQKHPHRDWAQLRALPYADGAGQIAAWIADALSRSPPSRHLDKFWFGLCNLGSASGGTTADIHVYGTDLPRERETWIPQTEYGGSEILAAIYRIAYPLPRGATSPAKDAPLENDAEYPLCLGFGALAVRDAVRTLGPRSALHRSAVLVGFDCGDAVEVHVHGTARPKLVLASTTGPPDDASSKRGTVFRIELRSAYDGDFIARHFRDSTNVWDDRRLMSIDPIAADWKPPPFYLSVKDALLTDVIWNPDMKAVSPRVREALEGNSDLEFLPIKIRGHGTYHVIHFLRAIEPKGLAVEKSGGTIVHVKGFPEKFKSPFTFFRVRQPRGSHGRKAGFTAPEDFANAEGARLIRELCGTFLKTMPADT
jgi:hypothetical protein